MRFLSGKALLFLLCPLTVAAAALPGSGQEIETEWRERWQARYASSPEYLNRLALSESAYLLQHADNPIDWYPWSDEAFERAVRENRLILLSIGYASCHWCHVMEKESFSDPEVAALLNANFVSVKVDREQQPDIDAWYNRVVETLKGESGWPITVILTPDHQPVLAANYLSKQQLMTAATRFADLWALQPGTVKANAALLAAEVEQRNRVRIGSRRFDEGWPEQAENRLLAAIDTEHGGFGQGSKFPDELKWQFLLNRYKIRPNEKLWRLLVRQLDAMMASGLADVVFGGIFRYTTDRGMTRPHFEKMLYNQALMVSLYADAADWLDRPEYQAFAESIIDFVNESMRLESGGLAAALDADHEGVEGGYYLWPDGSLKPMPESLAAVPFDGEMAYVFGAALDDATSRWLAGLRATRKGEAERIGNEITAWNALWTSALLQAGRKEDAEQLAYHLWEHAWSGEGLRRMGGQPGYLDDYAYYSAALWGLYLETGDSDWKRRARLIDARMLDEFYADGKLHYSSLSQDRRLTLEKYSDKELPSPVAVALDLLSRHQTELRYIEASERISAGANAAIGFRPEQFLGLLQSGRTDFPGPAHIIAQGHGMVSLKPGDVYGKWVLSIELDEDWHVNASKVSDRNLVPTRVSAANKKLEVRYPEGSPLNTEFSDTPLSVYGGGTVVEILDNAVSQTLEVEVSVQACSSRVCLLPETHKLRGWTHH